jgi:hypothetical protein
MDFTPLPGLPSVSFDLRQLDGVTAKYFMLARIQEIRTFRASNSGLKA